MCEDLNDIKSRARTLVGSKDVLSPEFLERQVQTLLIEAYELGFDRGYGLPWRDKDLESCHF